MILILSNNQHDATYSAVANWLKYYGVKFIRVTREDMIEGRVKIIIKPSFSTILFQNTDLLKEVKVVWFRGFYLGIHPFKKEKKTFDLRDLQIQNEVQDDYTDMINHFFYLLSDSHCKPPTLLIYSLNIPIMPLNMR
jgi:hypothetical protein